MKSQTRVFLPPPTSSLKKLVAVSSSVLHFIDLKRGEIEHNDIGQMNLYLNYFKKEENTEGDNEPIGIVLGAYKDKVLIEYATQGISNQLFVSRYQLYLPDKKQLQEELRKLMDYE